MGIALVLHPDGDIVEVSLRPGVSHLPLMREHLGCQRVFCVALTSRLDMWLDEDGEYTQPVNLAATALAHSHGQTWRTCYGPVLLCSVNDQRDSTDLTRGQLIALLTHLADVTDSSI